MATTVGVLRASAQPLFLLTTMQLQAHQGSRPYSSSRPGPLMPTQHTMMPMSSKTPARAATMAPAPRGTALQDNSPQTHDMGPQQLRPSVCRSTH